MKPVGMSELESLYFDYPGLISSAHLKCVDNHPVIRW